MKAAVYRCMLRFGSWRVTKNEELKVTDMAEGFPKARAREVGARIKKLEETEPSRGNQSA